MLIISYGMPKSASTFTFQLLCDVAKKDSDQKAIRQNLPAHLKDPYLVSLDLLDELESNIPPHAHYVVKTHVAFDEQIAKLIKEKRIKAICQYRNVLDVLVSMLDSGKNERRKPPEIQREPFKSIYKANDAIPLVVQFVESTKPWIAAAREYGFPCFSFIQITRNTETSLLRMCDYLGIECDVSEIIAKYIQNPGLIGEINRGIPGRGARELQIDKDHHIRRLSDEFRQFVDQTLNQ